MILRVVGERMKAKHENDFLQKILEGARTCIETDFTSNIDIKKLIVDNCKTIYFAGHETTATTAAWSLMLLAVYPDWQARARAEVLEVCGGRIPAADDLRNLKVVTPSFLVKITSYCHLCVFICLRDHPESKHW